MISSMGNPHDFWAPSTDGLACSVTRQCNLIRWPRVRHKGRGEVIKIVLARGFGIHQFLAPWRYSCSEKRTSRQRNEL